MRARPLLVVLPALLSCFQAEPLATAAGSGSADGDTPASTPGELTASAREGSAVIAAHRRARRAGKPLLVVAIPPDHGTGVRWERGHLWGELIGHGGDEAQSLLAIVEVVCATMDEARLLVPSAASEPLALVVATDDAPARAAVVDAWLPSWSDRTWGPRRSPEETVDERIGLLAGGLRAALLPTPERLAALADANARALGAGARARVEASLRTGAPLPADLVERAAPFLLAAAARAARPEQAARLRRMLAEITRARLWARPPAGAGARWASETAAWVPSRSARYLSFTVRERAGATP